MWSVLSSWNVSHIGHWVALESCLLHRLDGIPQWNQCLVICSISNTLNDQFWYRLLVTFRIFHFVEGVLVLKENIFSYCGQNNISL